MKPGCVKVMLRNGSCIQFEGDNEYVVNIYSQLCYDMLQQGVRMYRDGVRDLEVCIVLEEIASVQKEFGGEE